MPSYTPNFRLYKPNREDVNIEVDTSLSENFQKIDNRLAQNGKEFEERGINVKTLGAVGDGITDDTLIIQSALNLALTKAVHLFFPDGVYKLTAVLKMYNNTHITLSDNAVLLRCHNASFLMNGDYNAEYTGYEGHGNITIEGGRLDGNILAFPANFSGINLGHGKNITIRNMTFKDMVFGHWLDISGCSDVSVETCKFLGFKDPGSREYAEAIQISTHTQAGFPAFGAYDNTPSKNITVKDCYFGASGTAGTSAWAVGVGDHGSIQGVYNSNIKIINNTFEKLTYAGVRIFKFKDVLVDSNSFLDCKSGVIISNPSTFAEASKNTIIANNFFSNTVGRDIEAGAWFVNNVPSKMESILIKDNVFYKDGVATTDAIYIRLANNVTINGNTFTKAYRALFAVYTSNVDFSKNKMSNIVMEAVYTDEPDVAHRNLGYTSNFVIEGNLINGTGRHALYVAYVNTFNIVNNLIHSPATETDNTRSGILLTTGALNGFVAHNKVIKALTGNQNQYGLTSTPTIASVQLFNNYFEGKTSGQNLVGTNVFDGFYITDSVGGRRKVTVNSSGALVIA